MSFTWHHIRTRLKLNNNQKIPLGPSSTFGVANKKRLCEHIKKHTGRVETKEDKTRIRKTKAVRKAKQFKPSQTVAVKKFPLCNTFEKENEDKEEHNYRGYGENYHEIRLCEGWLHCNF